MKKYGDDINTFYSWVVFLVYIQAIIYLKLIRAAYEGRSFKTLLIGLYPGIVIIPLLSVSFSFSMTLINSNFKCVDVPMAEVFIKSEKLDRTLITVMFSLYMFMVGLNLIHLLIMWCYTGGV